MTPSSYTTIPSDLSCSPPLSSLLSLHTLLTVCLLQTDMARSATTTSTSNHLVLAIDVQLYQLSALVFDPCAPHTALSSSLSTETSAEPDPNRLALAHCAIWQKVITYDAAFPEFQTKDGCYQPSSFDPKHPCDYALTPVGVIVRALDMILQNLADVDHNGVSLVSDNAPRQVNDDARLIESIGTIGVSGAVDVPILLSETATLLLQTLRPDRTLAAQLGCPSFFSIPFVPNSKDWTLDLEAGRIAEAQQHLDAVRLQTEDGHAAADTAEATLPPRKRASLLPLRFVAALLRVRLATEAFDACAGVAAGTSPMGTTDNIREMGWHFTGRITTMAGLVETLLTGTNASWGADEASLTGMYDHQSSDWDATLVSVVTGDPPPVEVSRLGPVRKHNSPAQLLSPYMTQRYHFAPDCKVTPSVSMPVALATTCMLQSQDAVLLLLGPNDTLIVAMDDAAKVPAAQNVMVVPVPGCGKLAVTVYEDAGVARKIVRNAYCNSRWAVMERLVNAVPPGGTIGLDNKLFTHVVSKDGVQDLRRFERGCRIIEFSDLRANARCLLEGQALTVRTDLLKLRAAAASSPPAPSSDKAPHTGIEGANGAHVGLTQPPARLPQLSVLGKAAGNRTIASIFSAALGTALQIPSEYLLTQDEVDESNKAERRGPREPTQAQSARRESATSTMSHSEHSGDDRSSATPAARANGRDTDDAICRGEKLVPCRLLVGTALRALIARSDSGDLDRDFSHGASLHPAVVHALDILGRRRCQTGRQSATEELVNVPVRSAADGTAAYLDVQQVAHLELAKFYAALAEEHERLRSIGGTITL
ncbi:hypothetical protein V8E36_008448 [Tilletia maclaganii]